MVCGGLRWFVVVCGNSMVRRFGFKSGICLLIAPGPVRCFSITFIYIYYIQSLEIQENIDEI